MLRLPLPRFHYKDFKYNSFGFLQKFSTSTKENESKDYKTIYKFPFIQLFGTINRLKLYQTALTGITIPSSIILKQMDIIETGEVFFTAYLGISGCVLFYSIGYFLNNFVGFVYINNEEKTVKLSYIDFWGKRKDEIVKMEDIVPMCDLTRSVTDSLYLKVKRYSMKDTLKLNLQLGHILDESSFNKVFAP